MGGSGSGNFYQWWRSGKKTVVEDCRQLDTNRWMREGILKADSWQAGSWGYRLLARNMGEDFLSVKRAMDMIGKPRSGLI